jgi:hypothetical protein
MLRSLSPGLYNALINILSNMGISRYYFNRNISKWIDTAMGKPIEVEM